MPRFFNLPLAGRERIKLLKKVISFPCFRKTGFVGSDGESSLFQNSVFMIAFEVNRYFIDGEIDG